MNKEYVGHPLQVRGAEKLIMQGAKGEGMHFLYVRNGLGLEAWISIDRCADITRVTFKGDNINYTSPCGYVAPAYYDSEGAGFLKSFTAGFFTTCGLTAVGSPCTDDGEVLPLHGTIGNTPAELNAVLEDEDGLTVIATIRDCRIFARKLVMKRTYRFSYKKNVFTVDDVVTNEGDTQSPYMVLYHCNFGYPLLDETSIVKVRNSGIEARDDFAQKHIATALQMEKPQAEIPERCYYFDTLARDGHVDSGIFNENISKGVIISCDKDELPYLTEWKMMGKTDYVLGLEPGNCTPDGRDVLRQNGTLRFLEAGETKKTSVKFTFTEDKNFFEDVF